MYKEGTHNAPEETIPMSEHNRLMDEATIMYKNVINECVRAAVAETRRLCAAPVIEAPIGIEEASRFTGLAVQTIRNRAIKGTIPAYHQGGLKFFKSELQRWIRSGKCTSTKAKRNAKVESLLNKKACRYS